MNQRTFISKVRSIFTDNNAPRTIGRQRSGSALDEGRLGLVASGDARAFRRKRRNLFADYQVILLVDVSGSMQSWDGAVNRVSAAAVCVHSIEYALRTSGAAVSVMAFNQMVQDIKLDIVRDCKKFIEECSQLSISPDCGGNHDGYAVNQAVRKFQQPQGGKVLLVFSDGHPSCDYAGNHKTCKKPGCIKVGDDRHAKNALGQALRQSLQQARRAGITCLGIGIQTDSAREFYGERQSASVENLSELYDKTAALLERNLVRG